MVIPILSKELVQFIEAATAEQIQTRVNRNTINILFSLTPADA
jgi:hypothetical protein